MAGSDIEATLAWDRSLGDPSVVVAVIDTGVDYRHPDLAANMWRNPGEIAGNGLDDDANGYVDDVFGIDGQASTGDPMDRHGHGSHCAGVIAAANNGMGTVGVAPRARVMALKADSVDDQGQTVLEESALVACLDYAVAHGATILSNSYGIYDEEPLAVREAFVRARDAGVLAVTAAGNMGVDTDTVAHYPSRWATTLDNMLAVGATDFADQSAGYSNFGATTVHLFAPGSMIYSTLPESDWGYKSGTSMAAPLVAGTAALLQAHRPGLSPRDSRDRMVASAEPLAILTGRCLSGGRLNARRALDCEPTPTPSVAPSPSPSPSVAPSPSPSPTPGPFRSGALALVPGWNLVGLPVARVEGLTLGEGVSTPFFAYHPGLSAYIQVPATPESLDAGQGTARGFWVFAAQATTLEYAGSGAAPRDVPLTAGWNLVASPAFRVAESGFSTEGSDRAALADAVCPTWPAPDGCLAYSKAFRYDPDIAAYRSDDLAATNTQVPEAWGFWMYCHTPMTMHLVPPVEVTGFRRNRQ